MTDLVQEIVKITKHRLILESTERIKQCLNELTTEEIWFSSHENQNSVGNLIIHLIGNITQYIISTLGNNPDLRVRSKEFECNLHLSGDELSAQLDLLMKEVGYVLDNLSNEDILKKHQVQCFELTTIAILIHVVEHCSYHTGQIVFYTKYLKNIDTGFYKDMKL